MKNAKSKPMNFQHIGETLRSSFEKIAPNSSGALASYIPELAKVDPHLFAASLVSIKGEVFEIGDKDSTFSLQSTSKPFVYSLAVKELGFNQVHSRVGVEPTGEAFNSIIELEEKSHRPFNPMINSGAIATTSLLQGPSLKDRLDAILNYFSDLAGAKLKVDESIFNSERSTAHRNRAIAYLMKHFNVMTADIEDSLDLYFAQCSIMVTTTQLAAMAATLANRGRQPFTGQQIMSSEIATKTLSLMFTCGMYDTAGEWAFKVGFPAKSGVSGAILLVVPGQFGLAIYSPRVDSHGHSVRGCQVIENIVQQLNINIFNPESQNS